MVQYYLSWDNIFKYWLIIPIYLILSLVGSLCYFPLPNYYRLAILLIYFSLMIFIKMIFEYIPKIEITLVFNLILIIMVIFLPFVLATMMCITHPSFQYFLTSSIFIFFLSLLYLNFISSDFSYINYRSLFYFLGMFFITLLIFTNQEFMILGGFLQSFTQFSTTYISIILSLVLLCATLSLLSFTYSSLIKENIENL